MSIVRHIRSVIIATAALLAVVFAAAPAVAGAQGVFDVCKQGGASGSSVCKANGANNISGPGGIIVKVSNIFAFIAGVGAVFVIMIGGFMYITANGDSGKASSGRSAVIYALVGLVVIVLGRAIIGFVVGRFK